MSSKTPEQIVFDSFEDARTLYKTFSSWSEDTFIGYVTAVIKLSNLKVSLSIAQWEKLVREMVKEGKI